MVKPWWSRLPGMFYPFTPSTLRVIKWLQKFDPSAYPLEGVRHPSVACGRRRIDGEIGATEQTRNSEEPNTNL